MRGLDLLVLNASSLLLSSRCCHLFGFFDRLLDGADHVKSLFRNVVVLAVDHLFEAADGILQFHIGPGSARERFRDMKRVKGTKPPPSSMSTKQIE